MTEWLRTCVTLLCLFNYFLEITDGASVPEKNSRICVIGAGYSGLATARYLKMFGVDFTVYEATKHLGGTWRYDPHIGKDEDGLPLFTSMYKRLRTNTPVQTMEYPGFPFPSDAPSFPSGPCFYRYLRSFAKKFDLKKHIQFRSWVQSVEWAEDRWNVTYYKSDTRENITDQCKYLIIGVGQYSNPLSPTWDGMDKFTGKIIHSHDYRDAEDYRGKRVLLVGAGPSGLDLAQQLLEFASKVVHSHHLVYNQPPYPKEYVKKPDIKEFTENGVVFVDGTKEEVDQVILCTGYELAHPFLRPSSGLTWSGRFVLPLYNSVVNIRRPSMMFVGVAHRIINKVLDAQAYYAARAAAGGWSPPAPPAMLRAWLQHVYSLPPRGLRIVHVNNVLDLNEYFGNLTKESGMIQPPPVIADIAKFNLKNRLEDWHNYRGYQFQILDDHHFDRKYDPIPVEFCPIPEVEDSETSDDTAKISAQTEAALKTDSVVASSTEGLTKSKIVTQNPFPNAVNSASSDNSDESVGKNVMSEKIQESVSTEKLEESVSTEKLQESLSTEKLQESVSTEKLQESVSTEKLQDSVSSEKPDISVSTDKPNVSESTEKLTIEEIPETVTIAEEIDAETTTIVAAL